MRCLMSARPCKKPLGGLASRCELRYLVSDAQRGANDCDREPAALAFSLWVDAQAGASQGRLRRRAVCIIRANGEVGFAGGVVQRMVSHGASDEDGLVERTVGSCRALGGRGTCVHVSRRWNRLGRTSIGGGLRYGRVWEEQRHRSGPVGR